MKYILQPYEYRYEIQKSVFLSYVFPLKNLEEVKDYLNQVKKEHPKATHYCYAYVFGSVMHSSDDGEPSGTAGRPMLGVLKSKALDAILAITVRYFGGIKLGAGGLLRSYVQSLSEGLNKCDFYEKKYLKKVEFIFDYSNNTDKILRYLYKNGFTIIKKEFSDKVHLVIAKEEIIEKNLTDQVSGESEIINQGESESFVPFKEIKE